MGQLGGRYHITELVPWRYTTACWKMQYLLDVPDADTSFMHAPSEMDLAAVTGTDVWNEMGLSKNTTLLPVVTVPRARGRPSLKDGKRVSIYNHKSSNKYKAKINSIGELFHVEKRQCTGCGQYGHASKTCQGRGYADAMSSYGDILVSC